MVRTTRDSPPPPTALNDTQKLGVVTVEKLPPDNSVINLARIRLLLDEGGDSYNTVFLIIFSVCTMYIHIYIFSELKMPSNFVV